MKPQADNRSNGRVQFTASVSSMIESEKRKITGVVLVFVSDAVLLRDAHRADAGSHINQEVSRRFPGANAKHLFIGS